MTAVAAHPGAPTLLPGGSLDLPGRGTTFVRHHRAPVGAPTLLLLHGLSATADANWFTAYPTLSERYGVVAIDHRGHGRGIRSRGRFRLADCADDAVAALDVLGIDRVVPVGYSMGGPIAQLVWHRHKERVEGLVLCATAHRFRGVEPVRDLPALLGMRARAVAQAPARRARLDSGLRGWLASELALADRASLVEAGFALARYDAEPWLASIDVPTAVVVTTRDAAVAPARQLRMAARIPGATIHEADSDHTGCVYRPKRFVPVLAEALRAAT